MTTHIHKLHGQICRLPTALPDGSTGAAVYTGRRFIGVRAKGVRAFDLLDAPMHAKVRIAGYWRHLPDSREPGSKVRCLVITSLHVHKPTLRLKK